MRIQFDLPRDYSHRLRKHPSFPNWSGREQFYIQVFIGYMDSAEFRVTELEHENRRLRLELDQETKNAKFWKTRAGGFASVFREPNPAPSDSVSDKTNAA